MPGAARAESGPKGVQMQQTDLPAGYNMFPEGTISFWGQGTAYWLCMPLIFMNSSIWCSQELLGIFPFCLAGPGWGLIYLFTSCLTFMPKQFSAAVQVSLCQAQCPAAGRISVCSSEWWHVTVKAIQGELNFRLVWLNFWIHHSSPVLPAWRNSPAGSWLICQNASFILPGTGNDY